MSGSDDDDGDKIELSAHALSALKDFYSERDAHQKQFEDLKTQAEASASDERDDSAAGAPAAPLTMSAFAEDWNASQFWYSQQTADTLARALIHNVPAGKAIAFVSAPSAFLAAKNLLAQAADKAQQPELVLLEFDERFALFPEFVRYDFNKPLALPAHLRGKFGAVIADPPFLNEGCQTNTALTVQWLTASAQQGEDARLAICTGERMSGLIGRLYGRRGVRMTDYEVQHQKGLSNEFRLYSNFGNAEWRFIESETDADAQP